MTAASATAEAGTMERLRDTVEAVRGASAVRPRAAIVLGTGLGALAERVDVEARIPYGALPHMPQATAHGHDGGFLMGRLEGVPVVVMEGRFHRYEGHALQDVVFPVRVMGLLGARTLVVTGAAGGMNPLWSPGDLVLLDDHLNLLGENPLTGPNLEELGPRFPDMSEPYDRGLQERALEAALERKIPLRRGVYAAVTGPSLETRAEYRMLRTLGADVVGMSVVPEVIAARHMDMAVAGLVIVTDACLPDALEPVDVPAILATAAAAAPHLARLVGDLVGGLDG